jgi:hypothetical protein
VRASSHPRTVDAAAVVENYAAPPIIDGSNALQHAVTVSLESLNISPLELAEISIESAALQWHHTAYPR